MTNYVPYGNYWGGDALYNLRIGIYGIEASFRFISKDTVPVSKIRYFNTYSFTKTGYHSGTGGKIRIEIQSDDNTINHNPSGKCLAFGLVPDPLNSPDQLMVEFNETVVLDKGKIYHIVFTNYDENPEINHVSIDMMSILTPKDISAPEHPEVAPFDMQTLTRDKYNKNWRLFKNNLTITPIFSLYYDVPSLGIENISVPGYSGMESWVREPRQIQGDKKVKQRFILNKKLDVENVCVRVIKNGNPKPLVASIMLGNKVLRQGRVGSDKVKTSTSVSGFKVGHDWVKINFDKAIELDIKKEYNLILSADAGDSYETFPIRDGSYGFGYAPIWSNAWAEYTVSGDLGWKGWDAWGIPNLKISQLQLYFNTSK